jgi:NCS1 family nucleobase:cation symporter-1
MPEASLEITHRDPTLYNDDLAPIPADRRRWGWFEIFNVWANDVQSLFGYALAASLFITYGLNGWAVFAAIIIAGLIVMVLVNLTGRISVKYGVPYPVVARASMGVRGANVRHHELQATQRPRRHVEQPGRYLDRAPRARARGNDLDR